MDAMRAAQRAAGSVAKAATLPTVLEEQPAPTAAASSGDQEMAPAVGSTEEAAPPAPFPMEVADFSVPGEEVEEEVPEEPADGAEEAAPPCCSGTSGWCCSNFYGG